MPSCTCSSCRQSYRDAYDPYGQETREYDSNGYDAEGYDRNGYNAEGYDRWGYDEDGYNEDGYDSSGYDADGYNEDGYDRDGYDRDGDDENGRSRYDSACLESYSYRPRLVFRGGPAPFYGIELEVTTDRPSRLVEVVNEYAPPDLVYCKEDSSVAGAEIVTHPMSYDWAMSSFPWDMLPVIRDRADGTIVPSDNGIHVHVSRDGFDGSAHLYRWMKFWYRNPNDIQRIARRRSDHWGAFRPEHRRAQIVHVKRDKPGYDSYDDATLSRYSAINTTNNKTLEVRVFASTLRPQRAKAALQLVAGTVEYARQLDAETIAHRHGWDWRAFMSWASKSGQYPDLLAENRIRRH